MVNMKKSVKNKKEMIKGNVCGTSGCYQSSGCIYGLGFIGAVIYYVSTAGTFGAGVIGVLKALVWPAFLIFELFKFLGM